MTIACAVYGVFSASTSRCFSRPLSAWFARSVAELHQTAFRALAWVQALIPWVSCDQRLVGEPPFDAGEQVIHPLGDGQFAAIKAPRHFTDILPQMLGRNVVVDADDLPLQQSPDRLNRIGMDLTADVFASGVVDPLMRGEAGHGAIGELFIGRDQIGAASHVAAHELLNFSGG